MMRKVLNTRRHMVICPSLSFVCIQGREEAIGIPWMVGKPEHTPSALWRLAIVHHIESALALYKQFINQNIELNLKKLTSVTPFGRGHNTRSKLNSKAGTKTVSFMLTFEFL